MKHTIKQQIILAVVIVVATVLSMLLAKMIWESDLPGWLKVMLISG